MPTVIKPCRHGLFAFSPADTFIGRSLDLLGEFSEEEVTLICELCPVGGAAIHVGANIGCVTVRLARRAQVCGASAPRPRTPVQIAEMRGKLEPLGYRGYAHNPPLFMAPNFRGVTENPFPDCTSDNFLFLPDARPLPVGPVLTPLR